MPPLDPETLSRFFPGLIDHAYRRGVRWARTQAEGLAAPRREWPARCPGAELAAEQCSTELLPEHLLSGTLRDTFLSGAAASWDLLRGAPVRIAA